MIRLLAMVGAAFIILWALRSMQRFYFYQKASMIMLDGEEIDIEKLYFIVAMQIGMSEEEMIKLLSLFREEKITLMEQAHKEKLDYKAAIAYFIVREAALISKKASYSGNKEKTERFEKITDDAFKYAEKMKVNQE